MFEDLKPDPQDTPARPDPSPTPSTGNLDGPASEAPQPPTPVPSTPEGPKPEEQSSSLDNHSAHVVYGGDDIEEISFPKAEEFGMQTEPEPEPEPEGAVEDEDEEDEESEELSIWKEALRQDFEQWLGSIEDVPEEDITELDEANEPDMYGFYEQLAVANTESRKANRRTAEAFSQWADTLTRFEDGLRQVRESMSRLPSAASQETSLPRAQCLILVDLLDRLRRTIAAFDSPPRKGWWRTDDAWREKWDMQRQALVILLSHMEEWLKKEGVTRIETIGKPFDPTVMAAVATVLDPQRPANQVVEEIAAGYYRRGELLRTAQVKVTVSQTTA